MSGPRPTTTSRRSHLSLVGWDVSDSSRGPRSRTVVGVVLAVVVLLLVGYWSQREVSKQTRVGLRRDLQALANAEASALRVWLEAQELAALGPALDPEFARTVMRLTESDTAPAILRDDPARLALNQTLVPLLAAHDHAGYLLVAADGTILSSDRMEDIGDPLTDENLSDVLRRGLDGASLVAPPRRTRGSRTPEMISAAPVLDESSTPIAVLMLRVRVEGDFARLFRASNDGSAVEDYAFDDLGRLLNPSDHVSALRAAGRLSPGETGTLRVRLSAPELGDERDTVPPLVLPVARALGGHDHGVTVEAYRSYHGGLVVGAWRRLPEYGLGVVHEISAKEAFAPINAIADAVWVLLALIVSLGVCVGVAVIVSERLRRRAERAIGAAEQLGQYELLTKVGDGGMGTVYRARHALLHRPTAVKVLSAAAQGDPIAQARFEREVQLTAELTHPNTIAIYDYGRTPEGRFYYAMEYIDGLDLRTLVRNSGPVQPGRAVRILRQAASSLSEAHFVGLVHRDIKPANIMLCQRGRVDDVVKVLDFGLVKVANGDPSATMAGKVVGTPTFLSPEVASGKAASSASDIFALGAVGYFLLSGRTPFRGDNFIDLVTKIVNEEAPPLPDTIPLDVRAVVHQCMAKEPAARPSAQALAAALLLCEQANDWTTEDAATWWASFRPVEPERPTITSMTIDVLGMTVPPEAMEG